MNSGLGYAERWYRCVLCDVYMDDVHMMRHLNSSDHHDNTKDAKAEDKYVFEVPPPNRSHPHQIKVPPTLISAECNYRSDLVYWKGVTRKLPYSEVFGSQVSRATSDIESKSISDQAVGIPVIGRRPGQLVKIDGTWTTKEEIEGKHASGPPPISSSGSSSTSLASIFDLEHFGSVTNPSEYEVDLQRTIMRSIELEKERAEEKKKMDEEKKKMDEEKKANEEMERIRNNYELSLQEKIYSVESMDADWYNSGDEELEYVDD
jgi:hypothetical protein